MAKDDEITRGLLRGQAVCQRQLLQRYGGRVWAQIARIVRRQEDAEEVYQDVFLKAFRAIGSYDPSKASLATWLLRIAYNEALNAMRTHDAPTISIDDAMMQAEAADESEADRLFGRTDDDAVATIEKAVERLGPEDQTLIAMYYYDGIPAKEIAYITNSTPATIASRLFRARRKLYNIIKESQR